MSKARNQEKAELHGSLQERQAHGNEPKYHCPFPNCPGTFWKEQGKPDACPRHRQLIADVIFILDRTHKRNEGPPGNPPQDDGPKIYIPKPGMSDQAIREARQAAGKGPQ